MPPLYPLPGYPRRAPSTLSTLACRLLEDKDLTALPPLADALRDAGRESDAAAVARVVATVARKGFSTDELSMRWAEIRYDVLDVLFWDVFDFTLTCHAIEDKLKDVKPYKLSAASLGTIRPFEGGE